MSGQAAMSTPSGGKSVSFSYHPSQNHLKEASVSRNHVDHVCFSVRLDLIVSYHLYDLGTLVYLGPSTCWGECWQILLLISLSMCELHELFKFSSDILEKNTAYLFVL